MGSMYAGPEQEAPKFSLAFLQWFAENIAAPKGTTNAQALEVLQTLRASYWKCWQAARESSLEDEG